MRHSRATRQLLGSCSSSMLVEGEAISSQLAPPPPPSLSRGSQLTRMLALTAALNKRFAVTPQPCITELQDTRSHMHRVLIIYCSTNKLDNSDIFKFAGRPLLTLLHLARAAIDHKLDACCATCTSLQPCSLQDASSLRQAALTLALARQRACATGSSQRFWASCTSQPNICQRNTTAHVLRHVRLRLRLATGM